MLLQPSNFLLLDEPTNHLDMAAKDVLLNALAEFAGTVVFVSHDRYFIDKLATRVFEIGDGEVHVFPGNYEDYLWRKEGKPLEGMASLLATHANGAGSGAGAPAVTVSAGDKGKRINPMKTRKLREQCAKLETDIANTEEDIALREAALGDFKSVDETLRVNGELETLREAHARMIGEWEKVSEEIELLTSV